MPGIIKGKGNSEPDGTSRSLFNFDDITQAARNELANVRHEAELIVIRAQADADAIRAGATELGRADALRTAKEQLEKEMAKQLATALPSLQVAAKQLLDQREAWFAHWETQAMRLAIRIAEKLVRNELSHNPDVPLTWVRQSLEMIGRQEQVTIELSKQDLDALGKKVDEVAQQLGRVAPTRVIASSDLKPGDCRVSTQYGEFDHRLETQLARLEAELT